MKRKSERQLSWATAPPCSRRSSSSSLGVKKSRSSASQEQRHLDQQDDLYLNISGEPADQCVARRPGHSAPCAGVLPPPPPPAGSGGASTPTPTKAPARHTPSRSLAPGKRPLLVAVRECGEL